jgi:hypothetical protein
MKLVGRRLLLFLLTLLSPAIQAQAAHSVQLSDRDGLFVASFTGDQNKLSQVAGTAKGGTDVIAKALYLRSTYQLAASSDTVRDCGEPSQIGHSSANAFCALILAGDQLLADDISGWAHTLDTARKIAAPNFATAAHMDPQTLHIQEFEPVKDLTRFFDVPKAIVRPAQSAFSIPVDWVRSTFDDTITQPIITVEVNGYPVHMVLDTGSSGVILDSTDAAAVHIGEVHEGWIQGSSGISSALGVAKQVKVGQVQINNLPVTLADTHESVFGIRGMQYLGAFRLKGNVLDVNPLGYKGSCQSPMSLASWVEGSQAMLLVNGTAGDEPFHFVVDSGNTWEVVRHVFGPPPASAKAEQQSISIGGVTQTVAVAYKQESMKIGDMPLTDQTVRNQYSEQHSRFRYEIGASYLHQHELIVDFNNGLLCVKPTSR